MRAAFFGAAPAVSNIPNSAADAANTSNKRFIAEGSSNQDGRIKASADILPRGERVLPAKRSIAKC
jgi:hypothetical protein